MRMKPLKMSPLLPIFATLSLVTPQELGTQGTTPDPTGEIRVHVTGIKKEKGQITCSIYTDPNTFLKKGVKAQRKVLAVPLKAGSTCVFEGVTPGSYAITVAHDKNANNKMDSNFLGIPSEPWGVSNNVRPAFRAPRWREAVFLFKGPVLDLDIKVD